jgi:UDP:flavonoid glycosyltransferase YjiC (YdhE family)
MKFLFTAVTTIGHLFPLVSTAWALRAAGHDVLFGLAGADVPGAVAAGLPTVNVTGDLNVDTAILATHPSITGQPVLPEQLPMAAKLFATAAELTADGLVELARAWRPDVIMHSEWQLAGPLAAAVLDVPSVRHPTVFARGLDRMPRLQQPHFAGVLDRHGVAALPEPALELDLCPPSMNGGRQYGQLLRPVPYNGGAPIDAGLLARSDRPLICVSLGTVVPTLSGPDAVRGTLDALADLDADIVLAIRDVPEQLPDNVRAAGWLPLSVLLGQCALVVHHGGAGTTLTALAAGVPQVIVPRYADHFLNAAAVTERGAGLTAQPGHVSAALIEQALDRRKVADEVRTEIAAMPSPADLVDALARSAQ